MNKRNFLLFCLFFSIILFICSCGGGGGGGGGATPLVSLTTAISPPGCGSVTPSGTTWYDKDEEVTLTAAADAGYTFSNWSGDLTGSQNPVTIIMDKSKTVTANFVGVPRTVTVNSDYGDPDPPVGVTSYPNGTRITVSCGTTPYPGPTGTRYVCTGWRDGVGNIPPDGIATSYTFTIFQDCEITWRWQTQYCLEIFVLPIFPVNGGTVLLAPPGGWYDVGTPVDLTAIPTDPNAFEFSVWTGDLAGSNSTDTVIMNAPKSVTANFEILNPRTITVTSDRGTPVPPAGMTSCPEGYTATVSCGPNPYPLDATGTRYVCTGYTGGSGDITPSEGTATSYGPFTITQNSTITWLWKTQYQLAVTVSPSAGGTVTLAPLPDTGGWYDPDTVVSCNASENQYYNWVVWGGDLSGETRPQNLIMNGPKSITASFLGDLRTVTVYSLYGSPSPAVGTNEYHYGDPVTVFVGEIVYGPPGTRYLCTGWSGGTGNIPATGSTTSYAFTITENCTVTWEWQVQYRLIVSVNPTGAGTVTPSAGWYNAAAVLSCDATASQGYTWERWSGDLSGTERPKDLTMDGPKTITANFIRNTYNITVTSPRGEPKLSGTPPYPGGSLVTASCGPNPYPDPGDGRIRYACTGWTGGSGDIPATGTATSYTFTITQDCTITWTWKTQYQLSTAVNPVSGGSMTLTPQSGGWYDSGTVVSCNATEVAGYGWIGWGPGDLSGIQRPQNLTMNSPKSVTANFVRPVLTVLNPAGCDTPRPGAGTYTFDYGTSVTCSVTSPAFPTPTPPFTEGFETGNISGWTTGGNANWAATTGDKHSGTYSARSGAITHSQSTYIERAFTIAAGGGAVRFWWRVSSEYYDHLEFCVDDEPQPRIWISGETAWTEVGPIELEAGTRTLKWSYKKDASATAGSDCGWIDDITVTVGALAEGFETDMTGWTTGGNANWSRNSAAKHSGSWSALSGSIDNNQSTYIEREFIIGPHGGTVTFWWKVSSEADLDWLEFYIDGELQAGRISGETDWAQVTFALAGGPRTLRWRYVRDSSGSSGDNCGWIDDITVTVGPFAEGFERGNISGWTTQTGRRAWYATTPGCSGIYCARSGVGVYDTEESYIQRTFTIEAGGGTVRFWWRVSSEYYDHLEFRVDSEPQPRIWISGETAWTEVGPIDLEAGTRTLKWRYRKDLSVTAGEDCGWVDDILVTTAPADLGTRHRCIGYTGTGSCPSGTGSSVTFIIAANSSVTWNWLIQHTLTVNVEPPDTGTVDIFPQSSDGYYDEGAVVTLMANAGIGCLFDHWSGDLTDTDSAQYIVMDGPKDVTANFAGPNTPSNLTGTANSESAITWSWTSTNSDWQAIAGGVLRTVAATLTPPLPESETCPRDGSRVLFGTIDVSGAVSYTIAYTKVSDTTWTCTADTNRTDSSDYYIDQTGVLKEELSTGDGVQASSGSSISPENVWFEIQNSADAALATVYPNITSYQETTGLLENTQYTRHVHGVSYGVYSDPTNSVSRYTLVHNATTGDFSLLVTVPASQVTIGSGTVAAQYPINIAYNYARCQMLYLGSEIGQSGRIIRIQFQRASSDADTVNNVMIFMGRTGQTSISDWQDTSTHSLVYYGSLTVGADGAGNWFDILLTTPFNYTSTNNLIISLRHQDGSKEGTYTTWRVDDTKAGRCVAGASDAVNPPPVTGVYLPNVGIEFAGTVTITITAPPNSTVGSTGVRIERSSSETFPTYTTVQSYAATYTKTDLNVGSGTWWYRIRFRNADGVESAYSPGESVTVE